MARTSTIVSLVLVLTALYILSHGPAYNLALHGTISHNVLVIYRPLQPVERIPVLGKLYLRYMDWWVPFYSSLGGQTGTPQKWVHH